jgi:hypothetical protein
LARNGGDPFADGSGIILGPLIIIVVLAGVGNLIYLCALELM